MCIRDSTWSKGFQRVWEALHPGSCLPRTESMRNFGTALLTGACLVMLAGAAHAVSIFTPPVIPDDDGSFFCLATNVSPRTLNMVFEVFDTNGGLTRRIGRTVPPLHTRAAPGASTDRFCRISIDGGRTSIRASVEVLSGSSAIEAVYSVP